MLINISHRAESFSVSHTALAPDYISKNMETIVFHNHLDYGHMVNFESINREGEKTWSKGTQVLGKKR